MSVTIDLPPDVEARLAAQAAEVGVPLVQHLRQLLEEHAGASQPTRKTPEERARHWRESAAGLPDTKPLSDEAISRESTDAEREARGTLTAEREAEAAGGSRKSIEERIKLWRDVSGLPETEPLSDEAISRESIYGERG
jgi:hypothetical protein